jgi:cell division protein FtsQ
VTGPRRGDAPEAGLPDARMQGAWAGEAGAFRGPRESALAGDPRGPAAPAGLREPAAPIGLREPAVPAGPRARRSLARTPSPWRTGFFGLAAVGTAAGLAWVLLGSPLLVVRSVAVTGTHLVPVSEVKAAAGIPVGLPMIRVDTGAVAGRVEAIAQVESAQVTKSWPDQIVIAVRERTPSLAVPVPSSVSASGGYDLIDGSGVIVRWTRVKPPAMPLYQTTAVPAALRGNPAVAAAVTVLDQVPAWISRSTLAVAAPSPQDVTLRLSGRVTIVWGGTGRPTAKAAVLAILMRTHARYYDVSAPGTAVTR